MPERYNLAAVDAKMQALIEYGPTPPTASHSQHLETSGNTLPITPLLPCKRQVKINQISAFESHPENQPPAPNPTMFFTFDFIRSTHHQLKSIDATKYAADDKGANEAMAEVIGRNGFTNMLIGDTTGRMSSMLGSGGREPVNFGPDIKRTAQDLVDIKPVA